MYLNKKIDTNLVVAKEIANSNACAKYVFWINNHMVWNFMIRATIYQILNNEYL
jgi:hypothetical protein